jgi:hypothetical protein
MTWNPRKKPVANNTPYQAIAKLPNETKSGLAFHSK